MGLRLSADKHQLFHHRRWMAYRSVLEEISSGKLLLIRNSFYGVENMGILSGGNRLNEMLPIFLKDRLNYLIDKQIKRPAYSYIPQIVEERFASFVQLDSNEEHQGPQRMTIPALIFTTRHKMDDYEADDMKCGDLDIETLKSKYNIDVNNASSVVGPVELIKKQADTRSIRSLDAETPMLEPLYLSISENFFKKDAPPIEKVTQEEAAAMMFDEFRESAANLTPLGGSENIIMKMIKHMQENTGKPFSSPFLDSALKEQILEDNSSSSTLLNIKKTLASSIDYDNGFIPKDKESRFRENIQKQTVLPKFDRWLDYVNALGLSVHDTWATHITLESLDIQGDSYKAVVHYRVQDHFGLDDKDILNTDYNHSFAIFKLWFVLQRSKQYGYKPFITEMNTRVEISGRRGE
ncbi:DUF3289 family protein [Lonsdalea quercina]|uniref:DUF3289 family protein n=1 Tax=Lonsdalea quercina TaxID=71657 RepID=UPI003974996E